MAKLTYPTIGDNTPAARAQRETYWRRLVDRWKASGLPKTTFCEREGISDASLHWWLGQLARRDGQRRGSAPPKAKQIRAKRTAFVPVQVLVAPQPPPRAVEVLVAGHVIRVMQDFDPETFRRLVALLEGEDEQC